MEKKKVNLGFNHDIRVLNVENNTLQHYPLQSYHHDQVQMSRDWEILLKFFSIHNIEPNWLDCNMTWGWYDDYLGGWTGCVGKV